MIPRIRFTALFVLAGLFSINLSAQPAAGFSEHSITSADAQRSYLLYVPESYNGQPAPLMFSFHGSGGYPQNQVDVSGFDKLAEEHGFIAVFPAGDFTNSVSQRSWNANVEAGVDDVQFTRDMISELSGMLAIDPARIYTSGFSGGARISSRLACELSDVLAAAAPVAGLQYPDGCTPKRPIPIITFHAEDDPVNNYEVQANSRPYWRMGVETALDRWRQANDCTLVNDHEQVAYNIRNFAWEECGGDSEIQFYQSNTGGHTWPGAAQRGAVQDISASELIWAFFSQHHL